MARHSQTASVLAFVVCLLWSVHASKKVEDALPTSWMGIPADTIMDRMLPMEATFDELSRIGQPARNLANQFREILMGFIKDNPEFIARSTCAEDMLFAANSILDRSLLNNASSPLWPYQMMDAYGKLSSGFNQVYVNWTGDMVQCTELVVWKTPCKKARCQNRIKPDFTGKYCLSTFTMNTIQLESRRGICIPSTCSAEDINFMIGKLLKDRSSKFTVEESQCNTRESKGWDAISICVLLFFTPFVFMVFSGTIYELVTRNRKLRNQIPNKALLDTIFMTFSAIQNTKRVFNTSSRKDESLACIDGLRALSMVWVVIGHVAIQFYWPEPWKNSFNCLYSLQVFWTQVYSNAEMSVDSFFCISGFLVAEVTLKHTKGFQKKFNVGLFYVHRFVRIMPAYLLTLIFMIGIFTHTGFGPFWPHIDGFDPEICRRTWWRNFLYINVYFNEKEKCLPQSWYLCQDTFFFLISPYLLYALARKPKLGIPLWVVAFACSIATPAYIIYNHELASFNTWQMRHKQRQDYIKEVYYKPWCRIAPFLIGMILGYIYYRTDKKSIKMNKILVTITWIAVCAMMVVCIFGTYEYSSGEKNMTNAMFTAYGTSVRPAWAIGVGWIIMACSLGYGGVFNKILCWKGFIPLSRLSYSYYLVHLPVIIHLMASRKENITQELQFIAVNSVAMLMMSFPFALMLHLLAEGPIIELEKKLRSRHESGSTAVENQPGAEKPLLKKEWTNVKEQREELRLPFNANSYDSESDIYWDLQEELESHSTDNEETHIRMD